mmetsp:Transcript_24140/g.67132  ORF Transcript_24140/g.67132 Transcript_24140/m.67132 type:complete len:203 (-) Transcript_24140:1569-2177(-)
MKADFLVGADLLVIPAARAVLRLVRPDGLEHYHWQRHLLHRFAGGVVPRIGGEHHRLGGGWQLVVDLQHLHCRSKFGLCLPNLQVHLDLVVCDVEELCLAAVHQCQAHSLEVDRHVLGDVLEAVCRGAVQGYPNKDLRRFLLQLPKVLLVCAMHWLQLQPDMRRPGEPPDCVHVNKGFCKLLQAATGPSPAAEKPQPQLTLG